MFRYQHPYLFFAFAFVLLIALIFIGHYYWRNKKINSLANADIIQKILPDFSVTKAFFKKLFALFGLSFFVLGLTNPQMGSKEMEVKKEGIDIVIALDVSNSMLAEDLTPNRLERAKRALLQMVNKLENDRVCIIVFGGQAYVQLPLTTDYSAAKLFINTINPGMIPTQGTAIGSAIYLGLKSLDFSYPTQKSIVVITDGENHEDDAIQAAKEAYQKGVIVHTIGMGSETGAPIPLYKGSRRIPNQYKKDNNGQTITTRLNEKMLREIAQNGQGDFVRATNSNSGLNKILKELSQLEKTTFGSKVFVDYEDYFQYFLAVALFFMLIEFLMSKRANLWLKKKNIFNDLQD